MKQDTHKTFKSPNPAYRCLSVKVGEASFASAGGVLPVEGTVYSSAEFKPFFGADYRKEFSSYIYNGQGEDTPEGGTLLFGPGLTQAQIDTPYREFYDVKDMRWHAILKKLKFIPVQNFPHSVTMADGTVRNAKRYLVREYYIPEYYGPTRILTQLYVSPVKFNISPPRAPVPTAVSYNFINLRGGFPECLHDEINIASLLGAIGANVTEALKGQVFPATNFIGWTRYTLHDTQEYIGGMWHRTKTTAYPPPEPDVTIATKD